MAVDAVDAPSEQLPGHNLIFVVGVPRSGTRWLQRMLASHPEIEAIPSETALFGSGLANLAEEMQSGVPTSPSTGLWFLSRDQFAVAARSFTDTVLAGYFSRAGDPAFLVERTPTHLWHLGLIGLVYPGARVIHIIRDGRDVARSWVAQAYGPLDVPSAARQWAQGIRQGRLQAEHLSHYQEVRYEELIAEPEQVLDIIENLGLPVDEAVRQQLVAEYGIGVNLDPVHPARASGTWHWQWTSSEVSAFDEAAGDLLRELGYPPGPALQSSSSRRAGARARRVLDFLRRRPGEAPVVDYEQLQIMVNRIVGFLAEADARALKELLSDAIDQVAISFRSPTQSWKERGGPAIDRLLALVESSPAWGDAVRSDQYTGGMAWMVVLRHRLGGRTSDRVLHIDLGSTGRLKALSLHEFGDSEPSSASS